jgi:Na+/H+ antiporter NhaD/arsenite permease-like protein
MFLDYFALTVMIVVFLILVYAAIYIHDIPYEMAKKRNHPHQDAIHVGGWLSLFTLHAIWPFLWIWATLYKPETGYGFGVTNVERAAAIERLAELEKTVQTLQEQVATIEGQSGQEHPL